MKARLSDNVFVLAVIKEGYPQGGGQYVHGSTNYEGELVRGRMHGKGVLTMEGMKQDGHFAEGNFEEGTCAMQQGWTYIGKTLDSRWDGEGLQMKHQDGEEYEGDVKGGAFHGVGLLTCGDGRKFRGVFDRGSKSGPGRMVLATGENVQANFDKERMTGDRTISFLNGSTMRFSESYQDDKSDVLYAFANGLVVQGFSESGRLNGTCSVNRESEATGPELPSFEFRGEMKAGAVHGPGMLSFGKLRYEGKWAGGTAHGEGTLFEVGAHSKTAIPLRVTSYTFGARNDAHVPPADPHGGDASEDEMIPFEDRTS
ncbi:hypothetical protein GUITHDRAFT_163537 [Guillardia theta CCMP2712]|uniref:MORN repeat-containing protein n=2 Tax=Guillardia theta TaxID=55529 RepID=L1J862_GUITC|nr:hypothetical protein GUITHDRAFT_163537 [Guillardia theta CCMP2712]EKX44728.1 hypothetical protein GUITHDRAFT_163537 [Guillardia theta CCMP2712]|eukprot:XP_005831708.1 hypothetical protein GUITHDRAFT_163537 [Guillardia theta CCMP2712]